MVNWKITSICLMFRNAILDSYKTLNLVLEITYLFKQLKDEIQLNVMQDSPGIIRYFCSVLLEKPELSACYQIIY